MADKTKQKKNINEDNIKNNLDPYSDEAQMNARLVSEWYDRVATGVEKCPFCDLKEKYVVKELNDVVLTMNLFPYIDGHMMVIPKRHVEMLTDLTPQEWVATRQLLQEGMRLLKEEMGYKDLNLLYREGSKLSGSSVKHLHIHVLPINEDFLKYEQVHFKWIFQKITQPPKELAKKLRKAVKEN